MDTENTAEQLRAALHILERAAANRSLLAELSPEEYSRLLKAAGEVFLPNPKERRRFIVNVSAMEGQFYRRFKTTRHPHTNMAKAALNMMTRTSAADYHADGTHMNAVDTGWVTDQLGARTRSPKEGYWNWASRIGHWDLSDGSLEPRNPRWFG